MRILQVVSLLTPDGAFGGPARVALNQCAELIRRGHEVTLAAGTRGYSTSLSELDDVPVKLFAARTVVPFVGFPGMAAPGLAHWLASHATEFDVVHIHFGRDLMVLPVAAVTHRRRIPYVLQTHGMVTPSRQPLAPMLDALLTRRILRDAAAVCYLTDLERDQLQQVAGEALRLTRLPNGVPSYPAPKAQSGPPEILFLGRLQTRKRPVLFVDMARALLADGLDARFTLVGPDEGEGAAVRAAIGDERRISWTGPIDPGAVPKKLAAATVYVLPAEREPYPMAVLEAMSVGLPVVVRHDCGLARVIADSNSGVVADGSAVSLAAAVMTALSDPVGYGRRARDTARCDFTMAAIGERLETRYREAVARSVS